MISAENMNVMECRVQWFWEEYVSFRWPESRTKSHVRSTWNDVNLIGKFFKQDHFYRVIWVSKGGEYLILKKFKSS